MSIFGDNLGGPYQLGEILARGEYLWDVFDKGAEEFDVT
jgi:hypothetical protein